MQHGISPILYDHFARKDVLLEDYLTSYSSWVHEKPFYAEAHDFVSKHIEKQLGTSQDFEWNRRDYFLSNFDDMNFRYKDNVFSVLIKIIYNGQEQLLTRDRAEEVLMISEYNNMIPCVFPIDVTDDQVHKFSNHTKGLNLFRLETNEAINPAKIKNYMYPIMSPYELSSIAIRTITNALMENGYTIMTSCDSPLCANFSPQIWFADTSGKLNWAVVRYGTRDNIKIPDLHISTECLGGYDGYFAKVILKHKGKRPLRHKGVTPILLENYITKIHTGSYWF